MAVFGTMGSILVSDSRTTSFFGEEFLREDGTISVCVCVCVCVCCGDILYVIKRPWYVNVQFDQYTV